MTREIYNSTIKKIRSRLFDKSFPTYGLFKVGARSEQTAQLYRDILLMCIEMDAPEAAAAAAAAAATNSSPLRPQLTAVTASPLALPAPSEIELIYNAQARSHLEEILLKVRSREYDVGAGGTSFPGEYKRYPKTIFSIMEILLGVLKPAAPMLTVSIHDGALRAINEEIKKKISQTSNSMFALSGTADTTLLFYREIQAMCKPMAPEIERMRAVAASAHRGDGDATIDNGAGATAPSSLQQASALRQRTNVPAAAAAAAAADTRPVARLK